VRETADAVTTAAAPSGGPETGPPGILRRIRRQFSRERVRALGLSLIAVGAFLAGLLVYRAQVSGAPDKDAQIVDIQLGGAGRAPQFVSSVAHTRSAVFADFWLIGGCGLALLIGALLARWLLRDSLRWAGRFGLFATIAAVLAACADNVFLLTALDTTRRFVGVGAYDAAAVAAAVKYCAFIPAAVIALAGVGLGLVRALTFSAQDILLNTQYLRAAPVLESDQCSGNADPDAAALARWTRGYLVPACDHPESGPDAPEVALTSTPAGEEVVGIGLSGGGIRAACTALGVLQSTSFRKQVVRGASYLVSVSGGGYTAGAFAQFLTDAGHVDEGQRLDNDAETAFLLGTPEEDHVRRHSSYLADTPARMVVALSLIAWHLLLTLLLVFGTAILVGIGLGLFYRGVPLAVYDHSVWDSIQHGEAPAFPTLRTGVYSALGIMTALALLTWLGAHFMLAHRVGAVAARRRSEWRWARIALSCLAGMIALCGIVAPAVIWAGAWFLHHTRGGGLHAISPILAIAFTYAASLGSLIWKKRSTLTKAGAKLPSALPRGFVQIVLVIGANVVLVLGWLLLAGGIATVGLHRMDTTSVVAVWILAVVVVFLGCFTDETTLSLHPFYRGRLAATFAVRRIRRPDGHAVAVPYEPSERTRLSVYGAHEKRGEFPHIVFAASATLGEHRAPPGQNRVPYTFCSHWTGGPDVGWIRTDRLEELAPPRLQRDLTVQGAVALSGAAIAASLGGQGSSWYDALFVLTGARLGAWMPNPAFVIDRYGAERTVSRPAMPRVRRLSYLLRELIGLHAPDGPLLQVTDGGFYDNLGLLELLRRGCTRIYCIDASGDSPPTAATLARTLTVARRELGVAAELADDTWSTYTAGGAEGLSPKEALAELTKRLSSTGLIRGTFTYPNCGPAANRTGELIVAKASLWPGLGYPLLTYAFGSQTFPHDSTADQFFDADQYMAYTELGRKLGDAVTEAMQQPRVGTGGPDQDRARSTARHQPLRPRRFTTKTGDPFAGLRRDITH
jgi:hypothetical protein